jgi:hypothetical protein
MCTGGSLNVTVNMLFRIFTNPELKLFSIHHQLQYLMSILIETVGCIAKYSKFNAELKGICWEINNLMESLSLQLK